MEFTWDHLCRSLRGYGLVLGMCSRELITRIMCRGTIHKNNEIFVAEDNY